MTMLTITLDSFLSNFTSIYPFSESYRLSSLDQSHLILGRQVGDTVDWSPANSSANIHKQPSAVTFTPCGALIHTPMHVLGMWEQTGGPRDEFEFAPHCATMLLTFKIVL